MSHLGRYLRNTDVIYLFIFAYVLNVHTCLHYRHNMELCFVALATCLISPLELLRTKMQSEQLTYHELGKALKITTKECGLTTLMRGLGPTLLRDVPFSGNDNV